MLSWGLPIFSLLLPFSTNSYGNDDNLEGHAKCTFAGNKTTKFIWLSATYYGIGVIVFFIMSYWMVEVYSFLKGMNISIIIIIINY